MVSPVHTSGSSRRAAADELRGVPIVLMKLLRSFLRPAVGDFSQCDERSLRPWVGASAAEQYVPMSIDVRTLSERVFKVVREQILKGTLPHGEPIRQDCLASELGVSKIPCARL